MHFARALKNLVTEPNRLTPVPRVRIRPTDVDRVVAIVNGWAPAARLAAGESEATVPSIGMGGDGHPPVSGTAEGIRQVAGRLHEVFHASTPGGRRAALAALLRTVQPFPTLDEEGHAWEVEPEHLGLAELVLALWVHAGSDPTLSRLGTCAGSRCEDAYADRTRAVTRRYCSDTCQNRAKVAAFRSRKRKLPS